MTPLESALLMIIAAVFSGLAVRVWSGRRYLTQEEWNREHILVQKQIDNIRQSQSNQYKNINIKLDTQFKMLRAIVLNLNINDEKKGEILNTNGGQRR